MTVINDLQNKRDRLALSYGLHIVEGFPISHVVDVAGATTTTKVKKAVGWGMWFDRAAGIYKGGGWHSMERLYYRGEEISSDNYRFHQGLDTDAPDDLFPSAIPHPGGVHYTAVLPSVFASEEYDPAKLLGVFKTLETANYDGAGVQTGFGYSPSPARHIADLRQRGRRSPVNVNWPAWVDYRDFCAELINWDDGALTPHQVSLVASAGGALAPGTYWVRIATLKDPDVSSASKDRATDGVNTASVVIAGGNLQFTVTWASQEERGATGYRVYIGTAEGAQDRFFEVAGGANNSLLVTTLAGASMGEPPEMATGALLRQISRFESHLFFPPPFELWQAFDRIAQITCMDWHYSGGKQVFLTPEIREPIFTLAVDELKDFQTYQVPRRQRYNQIIVNYRDLDQPDLRPADPPVMINRSAIQDAEGDRPFEINGGCMYRSQAERVGNYWARRLIDSGDVLGGVASPKFFLGLPGDTVIVPHDVPNWGDAEFYIEEKDEEESTEAGYPIKGRLNGEWYSDTDPSPLPRPFTNPNPSVYAEPPVVSDVDFEQITVNLASGGIPYTAIRAVVQFQVFAGSQRGRVWVKDPNDIDFRPTPYVLVPDLNLQAAFEMPAMAGEWEIVVVTESAPGGTSLDFGDHPVWPFTVTEEDGGVEYSLLIDEDTPDYSLALKSRSNPALTTNRSLEFDVQNGDRTLRIGASAVLTGLKALAADVASVTNVLAVIAALTYTVAAGAKYQFEIALWLTDSNGEGLQIDLNGGTAAMTWFRATYTGFDDTLSLVKQADELVDLLESEGFSGVIYIRGGFSPSGAGTFAPRFAQKNHSAGSLTALKGSSLSIMEVP